MSNTGNFFKTGLVASGFSRKIACWSVFAALALAAGTAPQAVATAPASQTATPPASQAAASPALPKGVERATSVEGITEYRLANGLNVLLSPDPTKETITVNVTYPVGSSHDNYGETGMAHLLEPLVFKGTPKHPNIP